MPEARLALTGKVLGFVVTLISQRSGYRSVGQSRWVLHVLAPKAENNISVLELGQSAIALRE